MGSWSFWCKSCRGLWGDYHQGYRCKSNVDLILRKGRKFSGLAGPGTGKSSRMTVDLEYSAEQYLVENNLKPKSHPGVYHLKKRELPSKFMTTAVRVLSHENVPRLVEQSAELRNYLWSRHLPIEDVEYRQKVDEIEKRMKMKDEILLPFLSQEQLENLEKSKDNKIRNLLKKKIYHWEPIEYNKDKALQYLIARSSGQYAALLQIFSEIQKRDANFKPDTLCDFGSGLGTSVWASKSVWSKGMHEVLCVDVSRDMNELAERLLRGGSMTNDHGFAGLYFRQFLAQSSKIKYDLVVSAYSLMELRSMKERLKTIDILWKKANKYLVIVEQGTAAGFKAVIEARDYILELDRDARRTEDGFVFSPCPQDLPCPRFAQDDSSCRFYVKHRPIYPFQHDSTGVEVFSYVVLQKGQRETSDEQWPRLIHDPLIRKGHCICRVCTKDAELKEIVLTRSNCSKMLYHVAKKSHCGDLLPVKRLNEDGSISASTQNRSSDYDSHEESDSEFEKDK